MTHPVHPLLAPLQAIHRQIRDAVVAETERAAVESLSHVHADHEGDTIYAIDKVAEDVLVDAVDSAIARVHGPLVLVAEGLDGGRVVLPRGTAAADTRWTVIVDPIDGTRGLMYQKRPAWILTGVAAHDGTARPTLADIELALQTEIPLVKQHLADELWAARGQGAHAQRVNRLTGERTDLRLRPSSSATLAHGFATIARFFPGVRAELAALDDEMVATLLGPPTPGKAQLFEDQYISSAGQMYELISGHDRFVADLRSIARPDERTRLPAPDKRTQPPAPTSAADAAAAGKPGTDTVSSLCCHPYDLCAELIARECGVVVTDEQGRPLSAPLNVEADVSWIGYANVALRGAVEPVLLAALRARRWIA
jgi:fructose-1,6-bisphosphatase/inositol monophosphatase family enzyme